MSPNRNHISASSSQRKQLADAFGVHLRTVYKSLNFQSNSLMARKIRSYAVNKLGCPVNMNRNKLINSIFRS